jgi:putative thioredoxin
LRRRWSSSPTTRAVVALARLLVAARTPAEALDLLARIPETPNPASWPPRRGWPCSRSRSPLMVSTSSSTHCCLRAKDDADARQEFLDLLETLGPDDPRTARYRKALSTQLF